MPFSGTGQIGFYPQIPFTVIPDGYNFQISVKAVSARHLKQLQAVHIPDIHFATVNACATLFKVLYVLHPRFRNRRNNSRGAGEY